MKGVSFPDPAAIAAALQIAVALFGPQVHFAPVERMRLQRLGSRFLETPLAESAFPRQQEIPAWREAGLGSVAQPARESRGLRIQAEGRNFRSGCRHRSLTGHLCTLSEGF